MNKDRMHRLNNIKLPEASSGQAKTQNSKLKTQNFSPIAYHLLILLSSFIILNSCAQQGTLTGGEKDTEPPKVVKSDPVNFSTGITTNVFEITFDEFFQLDNAKQKLVVSPPMKKKPEFKIKGKTLEIKILDSLQPNRTYALNFGDALVDLNEKNPYDNFRYVFSTGNEIDSLMMGGTVVSAFDQAPGEDVVVMLYSADIDSLPLKELPVYISKTDKEGKFTINNIADGEYKLFALKDGNNNFLYDSKTEAIGFLDSLLTPAIRFDTLQAATDTTPANVRHFFEPLNLTIKTFTEYHPNLYLSTPSRPRKDQIRLIFSEPIDTFSIRMLDSAQMMPDIRWDWYAKPDTLDGWIMDSLWAQTDTLRMLVSFNGYDSVEQRTILKDTLNLVYKAPVASVAKSGKGAAVPKKEFNITASASKGGGQELGQPLRLTFSLPVVAIDTSLIRLFAGKDSTAQPVNFTIEQDFFGYPVAMEQDTMQHYPNRYFIIQAPLEPDSSYRLDVMPEAFVSLTGLVNDSLVIPFKVKASDKYGTIRINIPSLDRVGVFELLNSKKEVIATRRLTGPGDVEFKMMNPGKYGARMFFDTNDNGIWDTGVYIPKALQAPKKVQPEEMLIFSKELNLKANWELEETWDWTGGGEE